MKVDLLVGYAAPGSRCSEVVKTAVRSAAWHLGIQGEIAHTEQALALQLASTKNGILFCPAHEKGVYEGLSAGWVVVTTRRHQDARHGHELFWVMSERPEVLVRALLDIGRMGSQLQGMRAAAKSLAFNTSFEHFEERWAAPLVSVIMPLYNAAESVSESIHSVLNQTVADIELIVIDDGSSDSSRTRLLDHQDPRIVTCWQAGGGPSCARNTGLGLASSDTYISFLDADDLWQPTFLERTAEALATASAALAHSDYVFSLDGSDPKAIEVRDASFPVLAMSEGLVPMGSFLIRREVLDVVGAFDENIDRGEDYAWLLKVTAQFDTVRVPEKLLHYRRRTSGQLMSHSVDEQALQTSRMEAFEFWAERNPMRGVGL